MYTAAVRPNAAGDTPGATALPPSASSPAPIPPTTRISSTTSVVSTPDPMPPPPARLRSAPAREWPLAASGPVSVRVERRGPGAERHPVGGRRDDRPRPGQVTDEAVQFVAGPGVGHVRGAFLELADIDQPERDRIVQSAQRAVAIGI